MSDIRFNCPSCGQSIEAPAELASQLIDCPTCKETIEVPIRRQSPQAPPPQIPHQPSPKAPPAKGYSLQPMRRHSIFYYVFWGTVSLFATLLILFVGFLFLTAAGAGFLSGLTGRTPTPVPSVRNLPAITDDQAQTADRLMGGLHVEKDSIEGITWYSPDDGYKTAVFLYIGKKATGQPWLRWKIRYYGDDWLFIRSYRVKIDQVDATTLLPTTQIKRDNSAGSVWETFDEPATKHADLLNQILASKSTYLRMEGMEGVTAIPQKFGKKWLS